MSNYEFSTTVKDDAYKLDSSTHQFHIDPGVLDYDFWYDLACLMILCLVFG
jgi:hypothetical protein